MNIIEKAKSSLPGHWHQGEYVDEQSGDKFCALGHIGLQLGAHVEATIYQGDTYFFFKENDADAQDEWERANKLLTKIAREQFPERWEGLNERQQMLADSIPYFNDHPETTEEDMILVFEKAAVEWDEESNV